MTLRSAICRESGIVGAVAALALTLGLASAADADITRIVITRVESPTFGGVSFGAVGQYEKLVGRAYGEVDPNDVRNALIVDLASAPRNARGMVEYSTDVYILKPVDPSRGNHRLFFELPNRGNTISFGRMNDAQTGGNDPTTAADAGSGFVMREGYTVVWSGWDFSVPPGGGRSTFSVPVASNPDGSSIAGPALEEFAFDNGTTTTGGLAYAAATLDKTNASLTVRLHYADQPDAIAPSGWEYVNDRSIRLLPAGTPFEQSRLYEFAYLAKDPKVAGLGFASARDLVAFMRRQTVDADGNPNPLAGDVRFVYSLCNSQSCRFMHDFLALGFNEDEHGHQVFDGLLNWVGAASGGFFNYRFSQPGRNHWQHTGRWYPERQFPFTNEVLFDPVTGETDGWLRRCRVSHTCPKVFEAGSGTEYWTKGGSLLHTDTLGNDLDAPDNVRMYLLSSLPHVAAGGPGICQQPRNPLGPNRPLRALLVALDQWASNDRVPPGSRVPKRSNGTLVRSDSQKGVGFPAIPGVTFTGLVTTGDLFDYGPTFGDGTLTVLPPYLVSSPYPVFVPRTDEDGNDIAGIRLPDVAVPLATYTGWALRSSAFGGDDLCDMSGQKIDLQPTRAARLALGDPRRSLAERYPTHRKYVIEVARAAIRLYVERLLLIDDVQRYIDEAEASAVGR